MLVKRHDDQLGQNAREVEAILDQDNVFAVLPVATIANFSGAEKLEDAKIPTFGWGINDEWAGPPNFFGHLGALCNGGECPGIGVPWTAKKLGKHRIGVSRVQRALLGRLHRRPQGLVREVREISQGEDRLRDEGALVRRHRPAAPTSRTWWTRSVDFVTTCMDSNGVLTLAKEMRQQGLDAIQYLPNGYDQEFMEKNGGFFQDSIVITQVAPVETKPRLRR